VFCDIRDLGVNSFQHLLQHISMFMDNYYSLTLNYIVIILVLLQGVGLDGTYGHFTFGVIEIVALY